jgi:hypothetical protein
VRKSNSVKFQRNKEDRFDAAFISYYVTNNAPRYRTRFYATVSPEFVACMPFIDPTGSKSGFNNSEITPCLNDAVVFKKAYLQSPVKTTLSWAAAQETTAGSIAYQKGYTD